MIELDDPLRLTFLDLPRLHQPHLLYHNPLQQFRRRFVVRVLFHQLAAHGKVEDGLAEGLDLVEAGGEGSEVVESAKAAWFRNVTGSGSGVLRRARLADASLSRVASRSVRSASSRSQSAISSSTLATMRCCSARGGRAIDMLLHLRLVHLWPAHRSGDQVGEMMEGLSR